MSAPQPLPPGVFPVSFSAQAQPPHEVQQWLESVGDVEPAQAHALLDQTMRNVLEQIRDGHPNPSELARSALIVADADFKRLYD